MLEDVFYKFFVHEDVAVTVFRERQRDVELRSQVENSSCHRGIMGKSGFSRRLAASIP
jgi:hypothetical protein